MANVHTHYDNLKVARDAPPEVIRAAYKTLCQKYHPDRHGDSTEAIRVIQIINTAYAVLSDPAKRREHDEWIARSEAQAATGSAREERADFIGGHFVRSTPGSKTLRSRRKPSVHSLYSGQRPSQQLQRALHRALVSLEEFTKKLFRKA
ncbi:J domain-containing protein [Noviherbaspirillum sp.]|jgi:DnaJ-class molecular chaperone|uniref:J domain-containing protein n=1 Tax=Noviherbaspirillum sp. TaxID=1926288 RepID=UPI0039C9AC7C